jgi:DNA-directed RNA polymerase subunit RPC12/RpoP
MKTSKLTEMYRLVGESATSLKCARCGQDLSTRDIRAGMPALCAVCTKQNKPPQGTDLRYDESTATVPCAKCGRELANSELRAGMPAICAACVKQAHAQATPLAANMREETGMKPERLTEMRRLAGAPKAEAKIDLDADDGPYPGKAEQAEILAAFKKMLESVVDKLEKDYEGAFNTLDKSLFKKHGHHIADVVSVAEQVSLLKQAVADWADEIE